ncbi:MAG TPA: hypothetical protein DCP63_13235 [Bacteroidetes bacterium]|nr:hypothetical protein [Bacteroidota bacterium]
MIIALFIHRAWGILGTRTTFRSVVRTSRDDVLHIEARQLFREADRIKLSVEGNQGTPDQTVEGGIFIP